MNVEQSDYEYGISFIRNCVSEMKKAVMSRCVGISESFVVEKVFDAAISRAFEQQPEGREAAAWMICYPDGDRRVALSPETSSPGATVRPLVYGDTTPPASVPEADGCWVGTITAEAGGAIDWRGGVHALYRDFPPGTRLYAGVEAIEQPADKENTNER